ncbi:MAG: oligosaccharide flippase family protein [Pseudomonadota bacterium]
MKKFASRIADVRAALRKPADARTLTEKLLIAGTLTSTEHVVTTVLRLASTLIITRMLAPEIFGLFAIIMTFQIILALVTDFGIKDLILTAKNPRDVRLLQTCWSIQLIRGFIIYGVILVMSGSLYLLQQNGTLAGESVYAAPDLPAALAISGMAMLLKGFESVNPYIYAYEMRLRRNTIMNVLFAVVSPCLTILIALYEPTVWALVIAGLLAGVMKLIMTYWLFEGAAMRFCWDRVHRLAIFDRGKWIMGRSGLQIMTVEADRLILSAFLPDTLFGQYFLAKQIFTVPDALIQKLHGSFGLQFFVEIISQPVREMQARYYKYRIPIDAVACIFAGGFLTAAPAVIGLLFDPRYQAAGDILQILGLALPFIGMGMIREGYGAQQRFRVTAFFGLIQTVSIWTGLIIALFVFDNITAAFFVIALHRIPELATVLIYARREGWIDLLKEIRMFPLIGVGAALGLAAEFLINQL